MNAQYSSEGNSFCIENYNEAPPFSSFFPALAGEIGKPLWLFYTNRGQAIASFGVNNKDGAMLEFLPANKAYQATPLLGFRTFLKFSNKDKSWQEPFSMSTAGAHQKLHIRPYEIELIDENPSSPLAVSVLSFGVPNEINPILARKVTLTNRTSSPVQVQVIDGLPRVVPYGMNDYLVKHMSRTIEAFAEVENYKSNLPFFKLKIEPSDRPELNWLNAGFFSFGLSGGGLLSTIVDPGAIFGADTSFFSPADAFSINGHPPSQQLTSSIMPCCMTTQRITIPAKQSRSWSTYFGQTANHVEIKTLFDRISSIDGFIDRKRGEMRGIYEDLVGRFGLETNLPALNSYAQVSFMDNVLRGGYPISLDKGGPILHLYSRKHGDMERDYNHFQISATPYSQGNGSFRDVNQNRRHDLFLNPDVGTVNLEFFFNLIQLDGFNPLVINPVRFTLPRDFWSHPELKSSDDMKRELLVLKKDTVLAGELYSFISRYAVDPLNIGQVFKSIIKDCSVVYKVQHGEGYWIDHWMYNMDHLDQYLAIFPDKKTWLLFEKDDFFFHDSDHVVRARKDKYVVTSEGHLRQFESVALSAPKKDLIGSRSVYPNMVRLENGQGEIFRTSLFMKLVTLATVKASSLDPHGMGLEMEADKPGWCDALNGLPGLVGASSHELYALSRLVNFILKEVLPVAPLKSYEIPVEIQSLLKEVDHALTDVNAKDFRPTWDKLATAREVYREKTLMGLSGKTRAVRILDIKKTFERIDSVLETAKKKGMDPQTKLPTSYFTYSVDSHELTSHWRQNLGKLNWKQHRLVSFLEGTVSALKSASTKEASKLYSAIQKSSLHDKKLGMYKVNASLKDESPEIGRIRVFAPGWLENESIFLHMHYKFLLEVLRSGLVEEFEKEIKTGLVCFRDSKSYGRSNFENSSFIASSSFPDSRIHGKGFVARLSGATSEFMSMIYFAFFGGKPFKNSDTGVVFSPDPVIPVSWFSTGTAKSGTPGSVSLKLFGVPVTYVLDKGLRCVGPKGAIPVSYEWISEGRFRNHDGRSLPSETSIALREGRVESLTIRLGKPKRTRA